MNMDQDYDAIRAEEIQRGDTIEFPSNHPDVKWYIRRGQGIEAPLQPAGRALVRRGASGLYSWQPVGRSLQIHRERGRGGSGMDVQIRGHASVRRYKRNHG